MNGTLEEARLGTDEVKRLALLAGSLPLPPKVAGAYRAVVVRGALGAVSGQFPIEQGMLKYRGRVGVELDVEDALRAVELAAVNVLAQINDELRGFARFGGLLRIDGFIASAPGFLGQPRLLDAASLYFTHALGPVLGAHARSAFSVAELPLNSPVELLATFHIRDERDA
jgi:enamine deaminase RidA (YjgF/YER057c/UK114 family)